MKTVNYVFEAPLNKNYKIALLADIHSKINSRIVPELMVNKPNMICIAGDLCNSSLDENEEINRFLIICVSIAPTYFSLGNHDFLISKKDIEQMEKIGVKVLDDSFIRFNDELLIGGMTSYFYHKCEKYDPKIPMPLYPEVEWLDEFEKQPSFKILMDHHPDNYDKYTFHRNIDLILSGHVHGGQIRILGRGIYGRSQGFFPKYDGGVFDKKLVVSRGLSNTLPIPRLWNPTELVFVEIKGEALNVS